MDSAAIYYLGMNIARPFSLLATVYDAIMDDIDYEAWAAFILETATARGWTGGRLLELGCGTGNATRPFVECGFDVVGLDSSAEMLAVARAKLPKVTFVQADFTTFELDTPFSLVYSVFDSLNNLLTKKAFSSMAVSVYEGLKPGGFFIFDVNTTEGLRDLERSGLTEGWAGEVYYRWEHSFDEGTGLGKVEAYCEDPETSFTEVHFERPYDAAELEALLTDVGFVNVEALNYPEGEVARGDEVRLWVVTRKPL